MKNLKLNKFRKLFVLPVAILFAISACSQFGNNSDNQNDEVLTIENDQAKLSQRMTEMNEEVEVQSVNPKAKTTNFDYRLYTIAEVFPPIVDDRTVQATMAEIDIHNARVTTSYNFQGPEYLGGLDLMEIIQQPEGNYSFRLRSGAEFSRSDVNAVHSSGNHIWAALATSRPELTTEDNRAAIQMFELVDEQLQIDKTNSKPVSGFAALNIDEYQDELYISSGDNAGITVTSDTLGNQTEFTAISDARWIDRNDHFIAVLSGDNNNDGRGDVVLLNTNDYSEISRFSFEGASIDEGKATIQLIGELAIISAADQGAKVMDLNSGNIVGDVQLPAVNGNNFPVNAVAADHDLMFISNGGGGVYVAEADTNFVDYSSGTDLGLELAGKLDFGDISSVNHIDYAGNLLVVAAGKGGTKVVILKEKRN